MKSEFAFRNSHFAIRSNDSEFFSCMVKLIRTYIFSMRLRNWTVIFSTLVLTACGSGISEKGPQELSLIINNDSISSTLKATNSDQLNIEIKNTTDKAQVVRMQGLKINFVSQPISPQTNQTFHFQIDKNKGAINITTTDTENQSQNTTVTIN
jgi:hypothetical protein